MIETLGDPWRPYLKMVILAILTIFRHGRQGFPRSCTRSRESKWYFLWNFFLSLRTSNLEFLPLDNLCIKESWLVCLLKLWQLFQLGHQFFSRVDSLHWVSTIVTRKLYLCWKTHIALLLSNPWKISCMFHQMNQKADLKSTSIMRNKSVKHKKTNHCDFRKSEPTQHLPPHAGCTLTVPSFKTLSLL